MSNIKRTHPGYYGVATALAVPWYLGLGVSFTFFHGVPVSADAYKLVAAYVPLHYWGAVYLLLGVALFVASSFPKVDHSYVRIVAGLGLVITSFWIVFFMISVFTNQMDAITVIPAWLTIACIEWAAVKEPELGPQRPGPAGPKGTRGPVGEQGETGQTGETGQAGSIGDSGAEGQIGVTGDIGPTGEHGATGEKGEPGPEGHRGPIGDRGAIGDTGAAGGKGLKGDKGSE